MRSVSLPYSPPPATLVAADAAVLLETHALKRAVWEDALDHTVTDRNETIDAAVLPLL